MKKIFILANKMNSGGTEVALLSLLNELVKYKEISITLGLLRKEGVYLGKIPKEVKVVEIFSEQQMKYFETIKKNKNSFWDFIKVLTFKIYSKILKKFGKSGQVLKKIPSQKEKYDIAVDFHGYGYIGTAYLIEKVNAKKTITFVHGEVIDWMANVKQYVDKYDKIFCVSETVKQSVIKEYPEYINKVEVFRNIIDKEKIANLAQNHINDICDSKMKLLTVGRLEKEKGYDLLLETARELKHNTINFKWYIIGTGKLYNEIKEEIDKQNLQNNVILLGFKENPYPYFAICDIYVQPSKHEGYGLAIAEARILDKPVVATNRLSIAEQITNGENGLLCEYNAESFYCAIMELINNADLRNKIIQNLKKESANSNNDIYKLLEE